MYFIDQRFLITNVKQRYWKNIYKKIKKKKKENEKVANGKLRNLKNLGNLGNIIPSFFISEFSSFSYSQNRKPRNKKTWKKFS